MNTLKKILSYLSSFCIVILAICLTTSFLLKKNMQTKAIDSYLKENDISFILKNKDGSEQELLQDTRTLLKEMNIPENTIETVLNSDATKEFIAKYLTDVLNYLVYHNANTSITKEDLIELAEENFDVIEEELKQEGLTFSEEEKESIYSFIDTYADDVFLFFPTANEVLQKLNQKDVVIYKSITLENITDTIFLFTNESFILICIFLLCFFGILIFLCNDKKKIVWRYYKIATLSYSCFFLMIEIILGTVIKNVLMQKLESARVFLNYLVNVLSKDIWIFLLLSIFLTLVFQRLGNVHKKKKSILEELYLE